MAVDAGQISEAGEEEDDLQLAFDDPESTIHATWHQRYPVNWDEVPLPPSELEWLEEISGGKIDTVWRVPVKGVAGTWHIRLEQT